jgi:DNA-binding response OmpR family regulator
MARILLLDDDPHLCLLYWAELTRDGHTVKVARHAAAAVRAIRAFRPDLIVMEADLPPCCSAVDWEAARAREDATVPLIVNSGCVAGTLAEVPAADAWVLKSSDLEPLRTAIREVLGSEYPRSRLRAPCPQAAADHKL